MDYKSLLKRGIKDLPESVLKHERFEIPRVCGHIQGNRTIISNFYQIASALERPPEHLLKYVLKELATSGELTKSAMIMGRKISASVVNEKIAKYATEFVLCNLCKRPDTKLLKENKITVMQCLACGARRPIKTDI